MNNILEAFVGVGFTEDEAKKQLEKLGELIQNAIVIRMEKENPNIELNDEEIDKAYSKEDLGRIYKETVAKIMDEYLDSITHNLTPIKKQEFMATVAKDFKPVK